MQALLAFSATLLVPGLGHIAVGRIWRGLVILLIGVSLECAGILSLTNPALLPAFPYLILLAVVLTLVFLGDAIRCGLIARRPLFQNQAVIVAASVILLVVSFLGGWRLPVALYVMAFEVKSSMLMGQSMSPTLQPGDHFLVDKDEPWGRGDIVSYEPPWLVGVTFVGRVVGLPGESVEIIDGAIHIDGQPVQMPAGIGPYSCGEYPLGPNPSMRGRLGAGCEGNPITLTNAEVFILGDNSVASLDGRYWTEAAEGHQLGALPKSLVKGKATAIYFPFNRWRVLR